MKLVVLEPLGVKKEELVRIANSKLKDRMSQDNMLHGNMLHGNMLQRDMEVVYYDTRVEDIPTLVERSKDADIVMLSNFKFPKEVISQCPNLKMICVAFTGVDHVDVTYCRERGIMVCNCAGYSTAAVSDLVFGLILQLYRNISACDVATREGKTKDGLVGFELEGKKFGIIGAGAIGLRTAAIAKAFGCEVYAYSRTQKEVNGITFVSLEELLKTCDIVSLHVPQTSATIGMMNEDKFRLMKENAIFINTARGPIVDSQALAKALKEHWIAGAGIDVFEMEPPIPTNHVLFEVPNLVVTPHVAFATKEAMQKRAVIAFDNVAAWLNHTPINVIGE